MSKKLIASIFLILVLSGYLLGKWKVGRRGDRMKGAITENINPSLIAATDSETHEPVAVATGEKLLPLLSQAATELPEPPFLVSWCEGKDCEQGLQMKLNCDAHLYKDAKLDSEKLLELKSGTEIETRILYTKILKLGSYLPLEAPKRTIVSRAGKNLWVTFHDHAWDSAEWPSNEYERDPAYQVVYPKTEAWALVKTKTGESGFLKFTKSSKGKCPFARLK